MTLIENFHFLRPYWLLGLLPLAIILYLLSRYVQQSDAWQSVCDSHLLKHLLLGVGARKRRWPLVLLGLGGVLAILALAGPTWTKLQQPVYRAMAAKVIVLDLSPSMYAADLKPSRLERAKFKVLDILRRSQEGQTGMVVFTSQPFVVSPLTQDANTIASMVHVLNPNIMPVFGKADIAWALKKAAALIKQAGFRHGSILLLTADAGGTAADEEAKKLHQGGFTVSVLGVGTAEGAPIPLHKGGFLENADGQTVIAKLNVSALRKLAKVGGGIYVPFTANNKDINTLLAHAHKDRLEQKAEKTKQKSALWKDEGRWLILFILPLALFAFRRGLL